MLRYAARAKGKAPKFLITADGHVIGRGRQTGRFNIQTQYGVVQGISYRHCTLIQRGDGYGYHQTPTLQTQGGAGQAVA